MYAPLSNVLNHGLEELSKINVDGLPRFENHAVFVPLDTGVISNRDLHGSLFKPDLALMSLTAACDLCKIEQGSALMVSQFVSKIPQRAPSMKGPSKTTPSKTTSNNISKDDLHNNPPQTGPAYHPNWMDVLLTVEVKREPRRHWPTLKHFSVEIPSTVDNGEGEGSPMLHNLNSTIPLDISHSRTRKVNMLIYEYFAENLLHSCSLKI